MAFNPDRNNPTNSTPGNKNVDTATSGTIQENVNNLPSVDSTINNNPDVNPNQVNRFNYGECALNINVFKLNNNNVYINDSLGPLQIIEAYIPDIFRSKNPCVPLNIPGCWYNYSQATWEQLGYETQVFNINYVYIFGLVEKIIVQALLFQNTTIPIYNQYKGFLYQTYNLKPFLYYLTNDSFTYNDMLLLEQYFFYQPSGILLFLIQFMITCLHNYQNNVLTCNVPIQWEATQKIAVFPSFIERFYITSVSGEIPYTVFRSVMFHLNPVNSPLGLLFNYVISVVRDLIFILKYMNNNGIKLSIRQPNIPLNAIPNQYIKPYMYYNTVPYLQQYIINEQRIDFNSNVENLKPSGEIGNITTEQLLLI
jgi:hypothetical protein